MRRSPSTSTRMRRSQVAPITITAVMARLRESRYSTAITTQTDLRNEPSNAVNVNGIVTSVGGASSSAIFSYGGTTFVHNAPTG